jgi:serine/threonine protein kinase/Tfp pilus assembly protein PilF
MNFENGTIINQYKIISAIGKGGMGEVFLAQDTKLDRRVAIKFLHEEFSKDADKLNRFIQEAKAASALNHPNIMTVYEIGETGDANYIVTELIDGKTLRAHLPHKDSLQLYTILKIGVQVAEALSAAHQAGIIHRDIKPENIMLRKDGYAKVLDFGLAKLTEKKTTDEVSLEGETRVFVNTTPGVVMGTVSYMSPEQARGKETDARTDIWSLGVVLYEMLAGKVPFTGETINHTIVSILEREPLLLENVPGELQRIIRKALTKDVEMRYQSAHDLLIDLKNLRRDLDIQGELERSVVPNRETANASIENATQMYAADAVEATKNGQAAATQNVTTSSSSLEYAVTQAKSHKLVTAIVGIVLLGIVATIVYFAFVSIGSTRQINSIAVMPFVNDSGNADVEYLSDGMTETLINSLSQIPNLSVKARSSVFRYNGKEIDPKKIAAELNVQAILTGRVVQRGNQLTLNLELIDAQTENILWGNRYERKSSELVALQSEIARDVSNKLKTKLSGADAAKVEKNYTANTEAYQLFLKGRFYGSKRTAKDAQKSIEYFQQAAAIDPNYALAYAGLAESNWFLALYSYPQVNEVVPKARELALKALELDSTLAEPHSILGVICFNYDHDFACMERETKRAIELNPNYTEGHRRYGLLLYDLGRFEEARIAVRRALEIDPLSPVTNQNYAQLLFYERKYDESETLSKKNVELDPNFWYAHWQLFYVYRMKRDYASAVEELAKVQDARGEPDAAKLIRESFAKGDWQGFLRKITGERTRLKLYPYFVATFFAELGEKDKAFATLNEAIETKDQHTGQMKVDPYMDPLRDDPRFHEVLKKAGFPE